MARFSASGTRPAPLLEEQLAELRDGLVDAVAEEVRLVGPGPRHEQDHADHPEADGPDGEAAEPQAAPLP